MRLATLVCDPTAAKPYENRRQVWVRSLLINSSPGWPLAAHVAQECRLSNMARVGTVNIRVRYRPARIGWCVREGNWDDLRLALRLTHVFWGGRFNPVIPVGSSAADELVRRFRVDVLFGLDDGPGIKEFIERFDELPWPFFDAGLFTSDHVPRFLDVSHPLQSIVIEPEETAIHALPSSGLTLVQWREDDPLADVLLATFGAYPKSDHVGTDYADFVRRHTGTVDELISAEQRIPSHLLDRITPSELSRLDLNWDRIPHETTIGFYVGGANSFADVVNYWNLRASDLDVLFLDPAHLDRMNLLKVSHLKFIGERTNKGIAVWSRSQESVQTALAGESIPFYWAVEDMHVIQGNFRPPLQFLSEKSVLASLSEQYGRLTLALQLPENPFPSGFEWRDQHFVVSVRAASGVPDEMETFWTPYIPRLNQWYGRSICFSARSARVEFEGIGIICSIAEESLSLRSIRKQELVTELFGLAGIDARPSLPGRIAARLISQFGGLQGCRVLKIAGVRKLIRKYGPLEDFDRTEAIRMIANCDPVTGQPRFQDYEDLFIEQRDPLVLKLKPEHAFLYLLDKGVFRVGLTLTCPVCELPFWINLDDIRTRTNCELCRSTFNVTRQLKDRAWAYRRSGLFGRENHQEGSIPVALTLQQLDTRLHLSGGALFLTNMALAPSKKGDIQPCETDIFLAMSRGDEIEIAIGECKDAGGQIQLDDAKKLAAVADAFPGRGFRAFIIFSKTAPFTLEEIENCRSAQPSEGGLRVIMLSDRELEPYFMYERTSKEFEVRYTGVSLEHMARVTHDVFFAPKPKPKNPV